MKIVAVKLAAVAAGGATGASLRYIAAQVTHNFLGEDFPYGTLLVNFVGSVIIGYLLILLPSEADNPVPLMRLLLITGVLGGFTTYSAFSVETLQLVQDGHLSKAGMNILLTLMFCFVGVWGGFLLARVVHGPG